MIFKRVLLRNETALAELKKEGIDIDELTVSAPYLAVFVWEREGREPVPFAFDKMCYALQDLQTEEKWRGALQAQITYTLGNCRVEVVGSGVIADTGISRAVLLVDNERAKEAGDAVTRIAENDDFSG
jgi:hypothetical protein